MDYFNLKFHGARIKDEVFAGFTLFIAMSYILVVSPTILSKTGMSYDGVFLATIIVSGLMTILSAFYTKLPIALAPGIGLLTGFLSFTTQDESLDYRVVVLATYASGIIIILFIKSGIYQLIMDIMDLEFRRILMSGIGLALLMYGISTTGLIPKYEAWYVPGTVEVVPLFITIVSLVLMFGMKKCGIKGHILCGLLFAYVCGMFYQYYMNGYVMGISVAEYVHSIFSKSYRFSELKKVMFSFPDPLLILSDSDQFMNFLHIVFLITITHFLDAIGTNCSSFEAINLYIDKRIKDDKSLERAITLDGVGGIVSGLFGISSVTTYAESLVGIISGGKTGLTALVTGICFLACIIVSPFFTSMPTVVASPALIYVGIKLAGQYLKGKKQNSIVSVYGVVLILYLGISFKIGAAVLYGLLGYILLVALVERKKPVKNWWITLVFICIQVWLQLYS